MKGMKNNLTLTAFSFNTHPDYEFPPACKIRQKINKNRILSLFILLVTVFYFPLKSEAMTFDSGNCLPDYNQLNSIPWADSQSTRYQLYFSRDILIGYEGFVDKITFFGDPRWSVLPTNYKLNIYISTTDRTVSGLSTTNLEDNHGGDKKLVFSGTLGLSYPDFVIDVDNVYNYAYYSGNILIDFDFTAPIPSVPVKNMPFFQAYAYPGETNITRTYTEKNNPGIIFNNSDGALRTQIDLHKFLNHLRYYCLPLVVFI
jgi:hypothetical protein